MLKFTVENSNGKPLHTSKARFIATNFMKDLNYNERLNCYRIDGDEKKLICYYDELIDMIIQV